MTDRELLEAAARAAGMPHRWLSMLSGMYHIIDAGRMDGPWNPLTDDGDALRLAVKLGLQVCTRVNAHVSGYSGQGVDIWEDACAPADKDAATRRAIVRAAAALSEKHTETPNG